MSGPVPAPVREIGGCIKRFWSDGEARRSTHLSNIDRKFETKKDTFACRFFQRLSDKSPCLRIASTIRIRLYDPVGNFIGSAPYRVLLDGVVLNLSKKADSHGIIQFQVSEADIPKRCAVQWGLPHQQDNADTEVSEFTFSLEDFLSLTKVPERKRLPNCSTILVIHLRCRSKTTPRHSKWIMHKRSICNPMANWMMTR